MGEDIYDVLRGFEHAYPQDIFLPLTDKEIEEHSHIVAKASAQMGRHMAQFTTQAADEIARLRVQLLEAKDYNSHWSAVAHKLGLKLDMAEMALQHITLSIDDTTQDRDTMVQRIHAILGKLTDLRKSKR
jgi:hypothetical protein